MRRSPHIGNTGSNAGGGGGGGMTGQARRESASAAARRHLRRTATRLPRAGAAVRRASARRVRAPASDLGRDVRRHVRRLDRRCRNRLGCRPGRLDVQGLGVHASTAPARRARAPARTCALARPRPQRPAQARATTRAAARPARRHRLGRRPVRFLDRRRGAQRGLVAGDGAAQVRKRDRTSPPGDTSVRERSARAASARAAWVRGAWARATWARARSAGRARRSATGGTRIRAPGSPWCHAHRRRRRRRLPLRPCRCSARPRCRSARRSAADARRCRAGSAPDCRRPSTLAASSTARRGCRPRGPAMPECHRSVAASGIRRYRAPRARRRRRAGTSPGPTGVEERSIDAPFRPGRTHGAILENAPMRHATYMISGRARLRSSGDRSSGNFASRARPNDSETQPRIGTADRPFAQVSGKPLVSRNTGLMAK